MISAYNKRTSIRDKGGRLLDSINTLLPNGNADSKETGRTMIQGIYNKKERTVYLTDLVMWNDELFIDNISELRLIILINKLENNQLLSCISGSANEVQFRMPRVMWCLKNTVDNLYYGLYEKTSSASFASEYETLINYAQTRELLPLLNLTPEELRTEKGALKLCCSFGQDSKNDYYLKDGLAFVQKEGVYLFGHNESTVQWKDALSSYRYGGLVETVRFAHLYYTQNKELVTHDGYIIDKTDPRIEELETERTYAFSYEGIHLHEPYATLQGLKYQQLSSKPVWSSMNHLLFKSMLRKNELPYVALTQELERQDISYRNLKS